MTSRKKNIKDNNIYIAGIGVSSDGLKSLQNLLSNIPADTSNFAIVVVQPQSANHKSIVAQSLATHTNLRTIDVTSTIKVTEKVIYVAPPEYEITIKEGNLFLKKKTQSQKPGQAIDGFFNSLAKQKKEKSIGIILSGEGIGGTSGIISIKKAKGITIAQQPGSSKYNAMPNAAIKTGMIDYVLAPEKIGENFNNLLSKKSFEILSEEFIKALNGKILSSGRSINRQYAAAENNISGFVHLINADKAHESISVNNIALSPHKKSKPAFVKSEKLLNSILQIIDIGIAIIDSNGNFISVNDSLNKLLGYKKEELAGLPFQKIIASAGKKDSIINQKKYFEGRTENTEDNIIGKRGNIIRCYITNELFTNDDGNKILIKTIRNIYDSYKYKNLLQEAEKTVKMGSYELDLQTKRILWTDELYRIFNISRDFIPTIENSINLFTENSKAIIRRHLNATLEKGKSFDMQLEMALSKNKKWLRATGSVKKSKSGFTALIGTVQDITFQKKAEYEIERLSWVASHTNNSVFITDSKARIEWINKSFEKLTGYKLKDVKGKMPDSILHGLNTDQQVVKRIREKLSQKEASTGDVLIYYTKDKKPICISSDIAPIFKDGMLINYVGIITDITDLINTKELQKEKEATKRNLQLLETVAKNFPHGIIGVLNKDLKYVFIGGQELKKMGHNRNDFIGEELFDKISPLANKYAEPYLRKALKGESVSFEVDLQSSIYSVNVVPLNLKNAAIQFVLVVIQNITERKRVETETLLALQQQKELNELKSKFVSIASHEFRTPLSTILSSADLVVQYDKPEHEAKKFKHIERIKSSVKNLTEILNDFLSLNRIEEGSVRNNPTLFNIRQFCNDLIEDLHVSFNESHHIDYQHSGNSEMIFIDKQQLKNVLINLLSNAIKYSPDNKTVFLTTNSDNGNIVFCIKDHGIGIPDEDQSHLFETFFRAKNAEAIQGTGMGLHIVKKYISIMGGSISFQSKLNKGSTFTITFPQIENIKNES